MIVEQTPRILETLPVCKAERTDRCDATAAAKIKKKGKGERKRRGKRGRKKERKKLSLPLSDRKNTASP